MSATGTPPSASVGAAPSAGERELQPLHLAHQPGADFGAAQQMAERLFSDASGRTRRNQPCARPAGLYHFAIHGREHADIGFPLADVECGPVGANARARLRESRAQSGVAESAACRVRPARSSPCRPFRDAATYGRDDTGGRVGTASRRSPRRDRPAAAKGCMAIRLACVCALAAIEGVGAFAAAGTRRSARAGRRDPAAGRS